MFGLKTKNKPIEEAPALTEKELESEEQVVDQIEEQADEQQTEEIVQPVVIQQEPQTDKFSLAGLLGKTESGMKTEFYAYQIKEFMQSVGKVMLKNRITKEELDKAYNDLIKYGGNEISISPYMYRACKQIEEKYGIGKIKFSTIVDYPRGESSFKARVADVREGVKHGLDLITVVVPVNAFSMGSLSEEKLKLSKICKIRKGKVGVAVGVDYQPEEFKKIVKMLDGIKCSHVALLCENVDISKIVDAVRMLIDRKIDKKIFVYTSISTLNDLSRLVELKVDKVYTNQFENIGQELEKKFDVQL